MMITGFGTKNPSTNSKLEGKRGMRRAVYATYRAIGSTCPESCPFLKVGCYGHGGNSAMHARAAGLRTFDPVAWASELPYGAAIRWSVTGDVCGKDGSAYRQAIKEAHAARPDLQGWAYTHAWADADVTAWALSLPSNMVCAASVDSENDALSALEQGWPTVSTVEHPGNNSGKWDSVTAEAAKEVWLAVANSYGVRCLACPAQRADKPPVGCADCLLCMKPGLVLFAAHGSQRSRISEVLRKYREK